MFMNTEPPLSPSSAAAVMGDAFPVVFFDGEQESSLGRVVVSPTMTFKGFQLFLSEKIGISPHQFSIYLADRSRRRGRIAVTGRFNFSAITRDMWKDCFFLVVLKRSRRERRRRSAHNGGLTEPFLQTQFDPVPGHVMLLRRPGNHAAISVPEFSAGHDSGRIEYERRLMLLRAEKEKYLMNMGLGSGPAGFDGLSVGSTEEEESTTGRTRVGLACEECSRAKENGGGIDSGFHFCVYDAVTVGFKSPAGPIARPVKGSG